MTLSERLRKHGVDVISIAGAHVGDLRRDLVHAATLLDGAREYDSTVARIAGNILGGVIPMVPDNDDPTDELTLTRAAFLAVHAARAIVAEVIRTEPT